MQCLKHAYAALPTAYIHENSGRTQSCDDRVMSVKKYADTYVLPLTQASRARLLLYACQTTL